MFWCVVKEQKFQDSFEVSPTYTIVHTHKLVQRQTCFLRTLINSR